MASHVEQFPSVAEFYKGRSIFLTGATGFIGKVFTEKILRCCPEIGSVFVLVRPRRNQTVHDRMTSIFKQKIFDNLRHLQPDFEKKVIAIEGDMMEHQLGISEEDQETLRNKVSIVFHSAATVRFDEPMRLAVEMNLLGVRKMVQLCKTFRHLELFLHVSTAYANCDRHFIEEIVYPSPVQPNQLIDLCNMLDDDTLDLITPKLLGGKPNTYTYTKQLAEQLLVTEGEGLPLAIVRPSIVGASWKEPFPGWIDNYNGPTGLYIAAGKGLLRSMKAESAAVADIVPVDLPVNLMITTAWYTVVTKPKDVLIYHSTTGDINPFTWGELESIALNYLRRTPFEKALRRPSSTVLHNNSLVHDYWVFCGHLVPAYMVDFTVKLFGGKPYMVNLYKKLHKTTNVLKYFTSHSWEWTHNNNDMVVNCLNAEDRKTFFVDPRSLNWPEYIETYILGTKLYVMNEDMSGLPAARAHLTKLRNIRYMFNTVLVVALWRILIARSEVARDLWQFILALVLKFVRFTRITSTIAH